MSPLYYHSAVSNDCNRKRKALIRLPESVIKIYEHADCTSLPAFSVHSEVCDSQFEECAG